MLHSSGIGGGCILTNLHFNWNCFAYLYDVTKPRNHEFLLQAKIHHILQLTLKQNLYSHDISDSIGFEAKCKWVND